MQTAQFVQLASDSARYWNSTPADPSTLDRFPKYPKPETFKDALFFIMVGANDCGFFDFTGLPDSQFSAWVSNVTGAIRTTMQVSANQPR
jgi:lysophospholipase L1-like esterase